MRSVPKSRGNAALAGYLAGCVVIVLAANVLSLLLRSKTGRDDAFVGLYLTSAALIVGLTIWYPRILITTLGVAGCCVALILGSIHSLGTPIVDGYGTIFVAVYAVPSLVFLGLTTWLLTIPWRRVNEGNSLTFERTCHSCGYSLTGLNGSRCPECGTLNSDSA
jgi:hypothetical protein